MIIFIHNESQITNWRDIASKPKAQNPKQHFQNNNIFFEFQAANQETRTWALDLYSNLLKQLFL